VSQGIFHKRTLLLAASPDAINASLYEKLSFNFIRDNHEPGGRP
jgi:hypothetical protein